MKSLLKYLSCATLWPAFQLSAVEQVPDIVWDQSISVSEAPHIPDLNCRLENCYIKNAGTVVTLGGLLTSNLYMEAGTKITCDSNGYISAGWHQVGETFESYKLVETPFSLHLPGGEVSATTAGLNIGFGILSNGGSITALNNNSEIHGTGIGFRTHEGGNLTVKGVTLKNQSLLGAHGNNSIIDLGFTFDLSSYMKGVDPMISMGLPTYNLRNTDTSYTLDLTNIIAFTVLDGGSMTVKGQITLVLSDDDFDRIFNNATDLTLLLGGSKYDEEGNPLEGGVIQYDNLSILVKNAAGGSLGSYDMASQSTDLSGKLTSSFQWNYIPEPSTATLSLLALAGFVGRRRRVS